MSQLSNVFNFHLCSTASLGEIGTDLLPLFHLGLDVLTKGEGLSKLWRADVFFLTLLPTGLACFPCQVFTL